MSGEGVEGERMSGCRSENKTLFQSNCSISLLSRWSEHGTFQFLSEDLISFLERQPDLHAQAEHTAAVRMALRCGECIHWDVGEPSYLSLSIILKPSSRFA